MNTDLIQQSIESLRKNRNQVMEQHSLWDEAHRKLKRLPQFVVLDEAIAYINDERSAINAERADIDRAIEAIMKICPHAFQYDSHGHNHSVYVCKYCGEEEER